MSSFNDHQTAAPLPTPPPPSPTVSLTRFTVHPDRRADLVGAVQAAGGQLTLPVPDGTLLVELEDGDWLVISITGAQAAVDDTAYLDIADGILGDESGQIVAVAGAATAGPANPPTLP